MGKNNIQLYNLAKSYLGQGGRTFRNFCGLPSGAAWCAAFVSYIFAKGGDSSLFYGGKKVVYVPTAERWLFANCANIPIFLAMPMDVLTFDWNNNGVPDHIGFVRQRKSDTEVYTIEGNTSGGIVAQRTRPAKYISGCFRIGFAPSSSWSADKALAIDGQCGYSTITVLQKVLKKKGCYSDKVDAILGKNTVKGIQKLCGVAQDGSWGQKTSKAFQKLLGVTADGWFGENSVKAMQKWLNKQNVSTPSKKPVAQKTIWDKANAWATAMANDPHYGYRQFTDRIRTQICAICNKFAKTDKDYGTNCIGWVFQIWHHGAGIPCNCSPEVINNQTANQLIRVKAAEALAIVRERVGIKDVAVYRTANYFPIKNLKQGDIVVLYHPDLDYYHMMFYMGNGLFSDARSNRGVVANVHIESDMIPDIKMVIRYTGKVVIS